jgi:hypothetical protein
MKGKNDNRKTRQRLSFNIRYSLIGLRRLISNREEKMKKIKHNDLTHYFLRDHKELPASYLASCKKFFYDLKVNNRNEVKKNEKN